VSDGFNPGVDAARAAGVPITRADYPPGSAGIRCSLEAMILKIREGRVDPRITEWRRAIFAKHGIDGRDGSQHYKKMQVILDEVRAITIYDPDAYGTEVVQGAAATACLAPGLCLRGGDCDDITVLIVAMLLSAAIPARIIKQAWSGAAQEHVLAGGQLENGDWLRMDGSTRKPLGSSHVADDEVWIDPMEPLGAIPDAKAEIIIVAGVGRGGGGGGHGGGGRGGGGGAHAPAHGGGGHPHGGGGHGGSHRRFHNGRWWDWYPSYGWIVVQGDTCGRWGDPVTPSAALAAEASRQLAANGSAPTTETWTDGTLYLFAIENGAITIRPCIGYGLSGPPRVGVGVTTVDDVANEDALVDGQMESTNTALQACANMLPSDTQAWTGFYNGWKNGPHKTWLFYQSLPSGDPAAWGAMMLALPGLYEEQLGYQKQIPVWQQRIKQACPAYNPPPGPPQPQPPPEPPGGGGGGGCAQGDYLCEVAQVAKVVGVTGLVLASAYGVYKVVQVLSDVSEEQLAKKKSELTAAHRRAGYAYENPRRRRRRA
jgi:hypothetical protein